MTRGLSLIAIATAVALGLLSVVLGAAGQNSVPRPSGRAPAFEVVAIKPTSPDLARVGPSYEVVGGRRLVVTNHTVRMLVSAAYGRKPLEIVGPELIDSVRFDLQGVLPEGTSRADVRGMLQTMLAERFALRVKQETRPMNVHVMQMVKPGVLGPGLKQVTRDCDRPDPKTGPTCWTRFTSTSIVARGQTWSAVDLPGNALGNLGTLVVDRTGLTGQVDMDLSWEASAGASGASFDRTSDILNAMRGQLGLRVERRRENVELLVVDAVSMPTPN